MQPFVILMTIVLMATGCTSIHRLDSTRLEVIPVPQGMTNRTSLTNLQQRVEKGEPVIFKMTGGEQMPFKLSLNLPIGTLDKCESVFAFKQDTYFLISQKRCLLSPDGQRWANITSRKTLAKLFGFKHGQFSFGFSSGTNQIPFMRVEITVK